MSWWNNEAVTHTDGIKIVDQRADAPEFKRTYSARLDDRASVEVEARTFLGRSYWGTLTQPNGNHVWFEPNRVADKILDPALVPLVQDFCHKAFALDREYMASKPNEFVDKNGQRWRRVD